MLKIEDLKEGEIYLYDYNWLSKFPKGGALNINTRDWREEKKWWWILNIKPATPEQKHWFKECEKANKFIPYEEAMKTFKKENESLVGRYFKALEDDIQSSKTKKGEYYKIEESSTLSLIEFYNKIHKSLLAISKNHFDKIEIMPIGWTPEQENNMFKKGDYIVLLKDTTSKYFTKNYIYLQNQNFDCIYTDCDSVGQRTNSGAIFKNKSDWRYATPEEIAEYDKLGKPYDVTTLQKKQHKYEVVHCKTQEEWDFVISKLKNSPGSHRFKNLDTDNDKGNCIHFVDDKSLEFCWKNYYLINKGYKIYSFEEWCEKFGHKPDFLNKQEEWIPKVGDWVVYIGNNRDSSEAIKGKAYKLKKVGVYFPELEGLSEAQDEVLLSNLRKALPHEIPQENNNDIIEAGDEVEITDSLDNDKIGIRGILLANDKSNMPYYVKTTSRYENTWCLNVKLIKKASQTTTTYEKQVDSVSPQVNTDLILFKKAKKAKEIDILPVQSPIFVNQKVNNKKQLLILN